MFTQHKFETVFRGTPTIRVTEKCARDMYQLCHIVQTEVGWFVVCHEQEDGDFLLSEVLLPGQTCSSVETEFHESDLEALGLRVMEEDTANGIDPGDDGFRFNHMNCWCHSHCDMPVSPSASDRSQMKSFCQRYGDDYDVWIGGIVNRSGEMRFNAYYHASRTWKILDDIPWRIEYEKNDSGEKFWAEQVKDLVRSGQSWKTNTSRGRGKGRSSFTAGYRGKVITPGSPGWTRIRGGGR